MVNELVTPEVGIGATLVVGSDRYPMTIVAVEKDGNKVTVQHDKFILVDGSRNSESQTYSYIPNPNAPLDVYTKRKNGRFVKQGDTMWGCALHIGRRRAYFDPGF
jgi:hypothetical protein